MKSLLSQVQTLFEQESFLHEPQELYAPIEYTLRLGGKRIRPVLMLAANQLFGGNADQVRQAAIGIELFHNFTLLHDDLMDRSPIRRGQPTVYRKWDENTAILSGDTMYALAWRYLLVQPHARLQEILNCFNETAIQVCEGQQYDMNFERQANTTIDQYMYMIRLKTSVLLAGALKIGALYADAPEADTQHLYDFGIHLGLAFQLQDDLLDGYGDVAVFGKQTGQDIRDNKKSFLILKALQTASAEDQKTLRDLFASKPEGAAEDAKVAQVMGIYEQLGLKAEVEEAIRREFDLAQQELDAIQVPTERKLPLQQLMSALFERKK